MGVLVWRWEQRTEGVASGAGLRQEPVARRGRW